MVDVDGTVRPLKGISTGMPANRIKKQVLASLPAVLACLFLLVAVELFVRVFAISPLILPRPSRIFAEFIKRLPTFPEHIATTLTETICGLTLGAAFAIILALLITEVPMFRRAFMPLIVAQQVLPIIIFAPLILVWFGYGILSKVIIAALICFFPITIALIQGLTTIPPEMIDFARSLGATPWRIMIQIKLRAVLPFFLNSLKPGVTLASIGAVVGEFLGGSQGLGYLIVESLRFINLPAMFAATIVIVLQGLTLYWIIELINRFFLRWQYMRNHGGRS